MGRASNQIYGDADANNDGIANVTNSALHVKLVTTPDGAASGEIFAKGEINTDVPQKTSDVIAQGLLSQILVQLQMMNAHLETITDSRLTTDDIESESL
tara:strand:+ start:19473 stop:19769 length:297 start_codon:yes stop_codon:yes gene_type:complete